MTSVYPEWLTREDMEAGPWDVQPAPPLRGAPSTDLVLRKMRVPIGDDEVYRVIRAHELVHAKVSPAKLFLDGRYGVHSEQALVCAEEIRINRLVTYAGFDTDLLCDGTEYHTGAILGRTKDWNNAVYSMAGFTGSGGAEEFLSGVASNNPEMADLLRVVHNELLDYVHRVSADNLASTYASQDYTQADEWELQEREYGTYRVPTVTHPRGFDYTINMAKMIEGFMGRDKDEILSARMPTEPELRRGRHIGRFAKLVQGEVPLNGRATGSMGRKRRCSDVGTDPRNLLRLLDDPDKRIFSRKVRVRGGVILIDTSGSMSLSHSDITKLLGQAPGATVILYSHEAGSEDVPNVWVIANNGRVVLGTDMPETNSGNGVDGPAVRFASKYRKRATDPFIWICDGDVTDGEADATYPNLSQEAADLVTALNIHMVANVAEALGALKKAAAGVPLPTRATGVLKSYMGDDYVHTASEPVPAPRYSDYDEDDYDEDEEEDDYNEDDYEDDEDEDY